MTRLQTLLGFLAVPVVRKLLHMNINLTLYVPLGSPDAMMSQGGNFNCPLMDCVGKASRRGHLHTNSSGAKLFFHVVEWIPCSQTMPE